MACATDISGAFTFASMSFGITFERAESVILSSGISEIDRGWTRCVLAASFDIELVVETFRSEIAFFFRANR
jgi:hypothetical protein